MKLIFASGLTADTQREVKRQVVHLVQWIPTWVHELIVQIGDADEDLAHIQLEPDYRRATITLRKSWTQLDPTVRQEALTHEIAHLMTAQLTELAHALAKAMPKPARKACLERVRVAVEGVTCDLTRSMLASGLAGCAPAPVHPNKRRTRRPSKAR